VRLFKWRPGPDLRRVRVLDDFLVFDEKGQRKLRVELEDFRPDLVVVDTLYSLLSNQVDLGKPPSIRSALRRLDKLLKEFGPAVNKVPFLARHLV